MKITRREALSAMALLGTTGAVAPAAVDAVADAEPEPNYPELAQMLARWELGALQGKHPNWWQKTYYTSLCRWNDEILIFYGVGRPDQVEADLLRFANFLADDDADGPDTTPNMLGMAATPCGRAWVIMTRGRASDCCFEGMRRPSWKGRPIPK